MSGSSCSIDVMYCATISVHGPIIVRLVGVQVKYDIVLVILTDCTTVDLDKKTIKFYFAVLIMKSYILYIFNGFSL